MVSDPGVLFLYQIGLLIVVVSLVTALFRRAHLPGLIGAVVVGFFIGGPGGLGLVTDLATVNVLAVLGIVLLLFVTGLEFDVADFWRSSRTAFSVTTAGVMLSVLCGFALGIALGWSGPASFILGVVIAPSGTSVVAAVLATNRLVGTKSGSTLLTACVVDDVEGIVLLTIALSFLAGGVFSPSSLAQSTVFSIVFIMGSLLLGDKFLPRIIERFELSVGRDTLFTVLIGFGLLFAFAATLVGLSAITGAFILGAVIPHRPIGEELARQVAIMKDLFAGLFFASIGLSINPYGIPSVLPIALVVLAVAMVSRLSGGFLGGCITRAERRALPVIVLGLSVRAEMSLIIAREAVSLGVLGMEFLALTTVMVIGSILLVLPLFSKMALSFSGDLEAGAPSPVSEK
ncbi:MAG: cation:proton antiporter [Candidatus Thorarchaeota archaeon]|nr:cation:proton antiporter [Candidatus Thorarchaeota archaeon]